MLSARESAHYLKHNTEWCCDESNQKYMLNELSSHLITHYAQTLCMTIEIPYSLSSDIMF